MKKVFLDFEFKINFDFEFKIRTKIPGYYLMSLWTGRYGLDGPTMKVDFDCTYLIYDFFTVIFSPFFFHLKDMTSTVTTGSFVKKMFAQPGRALFS